MNIETSGRSDLDDFFSMSGILTETKLNHHPILAFVPTENGIRVEIYKSTKELLDANLDPSTKCMAQWEGKWRSDFFKFTVQDVINKYSV